MQLPQIKKTGIAEDIPHKPVADNTEDWLSLPCKKTPFTTIKQPSTECRQQRIQTHIKKHCAYRKIPCWTTAQRLHIKLRPQPQPGQAKTGPMPCRAGNGAETT